jgi:hypothetical protein
LAFFIFVSVIPTKSNRERIRPPASVGNKFERFLWRTVSWPCSIFFVELDHFWSKHRGSRHFLREMEQKKHHMKHLIWPKKITSKCNSHPLCRTVGPNMAELHSQTKCLMVCKALGLQVLVLSASLSFWWRNNCNSYQSVKWLISQYSCVPYDQVRFLTFLKFQSQNTSLELLLSTQ